MHLLNYLVRSLMRKSLYKILLIEAMINRATFYAHYADKDDLQQGVRQQVLEQMSDMIDAAQITNGERVKVSELAFNGVLSWIGKKCCDC